MTSVTSGSAIVFVIASINAEPNIPGRRPESPAVPETCTGVIAIHNVVVRSREAGFRSRLAEVLVAVRTRYAAPLTSFWIDVKVDVGLPLLHSCYLYLMD